MYAADPLPCPLPTIPQGTPPRTSSQIVMQPTGFEPAIPDVKGRWLDRLPTAALSRKDTATAPVDAPSRCREVPTRGGATRATPTTGSPFSGSIRFGRAIRHEGPCPPKEPLVEPDLPSPTASTDRVSLPSLARAHDGLTAVTPVAQSTVTPLIGVIRFGGFADPVALFCSGPDGEGRS